MNNVIFASVISEIQQSPMFMTVKAVICDTPEANLNGAKVTEAFVNEVVKNEKRYVGLPLYADVKALTSGKFNRLGHLYDVKTGEFHSTQIGSFYKFEKEEFDKGYHLIGYARIPKRNKKLSDAIATLFANDKLKFSFEVAVGEFEENDDGTITIDASVNNYLEGTAIVTYPACEDAVALELVAQKADDQEGGEQEMLKDKITAEQETQEVKTTEVAAEESTEATAETTVAEEQTAEQTETTPVQAETATENAETAEAATAAEETSTAEVYVRETTTQAKETHAYDSESGKSIHQEVVVRTSTEDMVDGTLVETDDGVHIAQETNVENAAETNPVAAAEETNSEVVTAAGDEGTDSGETTGTETPAETPAETPTDTTTDAPATETGTKGGEMAQDEGSEEETPVTDAVDGKARKTAEQMIAELAETVEALRKEIADLKEQKVVAADKTVTAEINPMVSDIKPQKSYSVLEKVTKNTNYASVLEKY